MPKEQEIKRDWTSEELGRPNLTRAPGEDELSNITECLELIKSAGANVERIELILSNENDNFRAEDALSLMENLGKATAYLNHEEMFRILTFGWKYVLARYQMAEKENLKRTKILEEDKKTEPEVLEKLYNNRAKLENSLEKHRVKNRKMKLIMKHYSDEKESAEGDENTETEAKAA